LKAVREKKQITYIGKPIKIKEVFSTETLKTRMAWREVFWSLDKKTSTLGYSTHQNYHKNRWKIKVFHDKQKLQQYMTIKPSLQKIPQGILHSENESKQNHERTGNTKPQEKKRQESKE
jgi:hypothetical protein